MLKANFIFPRKNKICIRSGRRFQNQSTEIIDEWPTPRMAKKVIDRFGDLDTTIVYLNTNIQMYTGTDYEYMKRMCLLMVAETVLKYSYLNDNRLKDLKKLVIEKLSSCDAPHLKTYIQKLKQL